VPFHPADFFHFGTTDDLRRLWNARLPEERDACRFAQGSLRRIMNASVGEFNRPEAFSAEQFLFLECLEPGSTRRHGGMRTINPLRLLQSEWLIASHFIPVHPGAAGIALPERFAQYCHPGTLLFRHDWNGRLFRGTRLGATGALLAEAPGLIARGFSELLRWGNLLARKLARRVVRDSAVGVALRTKRVG
jgi:hypothetical protein